MNARVGTALAALNALVLASGCSALIAVTPTMLGRDAAPTYAFDTQRQAVGAALGAPIASEPLPDGGAVVTYRYRQRPRPSDVSSGVVAVDVHAFRADPYLWLLLQPLLIPTAIGAAIYTAATPTYLPVTFTFGPHGDLLYVGRPPGYGAAEDVVAAPTVGALRRTCWTSEAAEAALEERNRAHLDCVLLRFAVWAIE